MCIPSLLLSSHLLHLSQVGQHRITFSYVTAFRIRTSQYIKRYCMAGYLLIINNYLPTILCILYLLTAAGELANCYHTYYRGRELPSTHTHEITYYITEKLRLNNFRGLFPPTFSGRAINLHTGPPPIKCVALPNNITV